MHLTCISITIYLYTSSLLHVSAIVRQLQGAADTKELDCKCTKTKGQNLLKKLKMYTASITFLTVRDLWLGHLILAYIFFCVISLHEDGEHSSQHAREITHIHNMQYL